MMLGTVCKKATIRDKQFVNKLGKIKQNCRYYGFLGKCL